jgi:hypothetical protein
VARGEGGRGMGGAGIVDLGLGERDAIHRRSMAMVMCLRGIFLLPCLREMASVAL